MSFLRGLSSSLLLAALASLAPGCIFDEPLPLFAGPTGETRCGSDGDCGADKGCDEGICRGNKSFNEACVSTGECARGLVCSGGNCVSRPLGQKGEGCGHNSDCTAGLICNWSRHPHVCTEPALVGDRCGHPTDCASGKCDWLTGKCECTECAGDQVCSARGCIKPGTVKEQERCLHNVDCNEGLACIWAEEPYVCGAFRQKGEPCGHRTDCAEGLSCDQSDRCDTACKADEDCAEGQRCLSTKACGQPVGIHEPCDGDQDCAEGLWCNTLIVGTCVEKQPPGSECYPFWPSSSPCQAPFSCVGACRLKSSDPGFTCGERLPAGAPCEPCAVTEDDKARCEAEPWLCDSGCAEGLTCVDSVCAPGPS